MAEATLVPLGPRSQIDVRARGPAASRVAECLSIPALPEANRFITSTVGDCFWLGPDEWLVVGPHSSRALTLEQLERAVGPEDGAVVDISSARGHPRAPRPAGARRFGELLCS